MLHFVRWQIFECFTK